MIISASLTFLGYRVFAARDLAARARAAADQPWIGF
jgi:hypothetical protein